MTFVFPKFQSSKVHSVKKYHQPSTVVGPISWSIFDCRHVLSNHVSLWYICKKKLKFDKMDNNKYYIIAYWIISLFHKIELFLKWKITSLLLHPVHENSNNSILETTVFVYLLRIYYLQIIKKRNLFQTPILISNNFRTRLISSISSCECKCRLVEKMNILPEGASNIFDGKLAESPNEHNNRICTETNKVLIKHFLPHSIFSRKTTSFFM